MGSKASGYIVRHPETGGLLCCDGRYRTWFNVANLKWYRTLAWAMKAALKVSSNGESATVHTMYPGDTVDATGAIFRLSKADGVFTLDK